MFENFNDGYHANKLHHTIQDFCPSELAAFPEPWDDASNVIFRTNGYIHIDGGFNATTKALMPIFPKLTEEERWRSTFALLPPTLCFGTAPDQAFFFIVRPKTADTIDLEIGYLFHPSAPSTRCSITSSQMSDAGVQVFVTQDQDATTKVQRGMHSPLRRARPLLVAGGEPRAVQPLARRSATAATGRSTGRPARARRRAIELAIPPVSAIADVLALWELDGWLTPPLHAVRRARTTASSAGCARSTLEYRAAAARLPAIYDLLSHDLAGCVVVMAGAYSVARRDVGRDPGDGGSRPIGARVSSSTARRA